MTESELKASEVHLAGESQKALIVNALLSMAETVKRLTLTQQDADRLLGWIGSRPKNRERLAKLGNGKPLKRVRVDWPGEQEVADLRRERGA